MVEYLGGYDDYIQITGWWERPLYWRRIAEEILTNLPQARAQFKANVQNIDPIDVNPADEVFADRVSLLCNMSDEELSGIINALNNHQAKRRPMQYTL